MPRLTELKARLYRHEKAIADTGHGRPMPFSTLMHEHARNPGKEVAYTQWGGFEIDRFCEVQTVAEADRVMFVCPMQGCSHRIAVDFAGRNTPDEACIRNDQGRPVRWNASGSTIEDLTLTPSILILSGCKWHGFVTNGETTGC